MQARGVVSRSEIAKATGLLPPTVTQIVAEFMAAGLVVDAEASSSEELEPDDGDDIQSTSLGRPPVLISLDRRAAFAVGVKLYAGGFTLAVSDLSGDLVERRTRKVDVSVPEQTLRQVAEEVDAVLDSGGAGAQNILGVGIGMPGLIDYSRGVCRYSSLLGWSDIDVRSTLEQLLDLPIYVDNDVNMLTAAEIAFGAGHEIDNFLTVTIGRGIGLGIVIRGEIYRGAFGGAGEFGHVKTSGRRRCECGELGCIESVASEASICESVSAVHGRPLNMEECLALAADADRAALAAFRNAGATVGQGVGNLANLFNPQRIIVTGEGMHMGEFFLGPMRAAIEKATFSLLGQDIDLVTQEWGDEAWAQGAAGIVIHEMLRPPIYESDVNHPLDRLLDRQPGTERRARRTGVKSNQLRSRELAVGRR